PRAKPVIRLPRLARTLGQTGGVQVLLGEPGCAGGPQNAVPRARRVTHPKLSQDLLSETPVLKVFASPAGLAGLPQVALVVGARAGEQLHQSLSAPAPIGVARVLLLALQLDPAAFGEQLESALEVEALRLLHEREDVPRGLAAEAVVELLDRIDTERR